ncbi:trichohyalin-like isoform X1 [Pseudochaenichthys georgianus]|uniref:trichohyalin-like isoform X1 n=1 Tax=Pseudochaenichthys georgianus TaxID=52239 RepID=UPI0039C31A11
MSQESSRDETTLQGSETLEGQNSLSHKVLSLSMETGAINQQNAGMSMQIIELSTQLVNSQDFKKLLKDLQKEKKAAKDFNRNLERQVEEFRIKLQTQTALQEKCRAVEEEKQKLLQENWLLQSEIVEINGRFTDHERLRSEFETIKRENTTKSRENDALERQIQTTLREIRKKGGRKQEDKRKRLQGECISVTERNTSLKTRVQELTQTLANEESKMAECARMTAEKPAKLRQTDILQRRVRELTVRHRRLPASRYDQVKAEADCISSEHEALRQQHRFLDARIRARNALDSECEELDMEKDKISEENYVLRKNIEVLLNHSRSRNYYGVLAKNEAITAERDAGLQLREKLRRKVQELRNAKEGQGSAMVEEKEGASLELVSQLFQGLQELSDLWSPPGTQRGFDSTQGSSHSNESSGCTSL